MGQSNSGDLLSLDTGMAYNALVREANLSKFFLLLFAEREVFKLDSENCSGKLLPGL